MSSESRDSLTEIGAENKTWLDSVYDMDSTISVDTIGLQDSVNLALSNQSEIDFESIQGMAAINLMLKVMLILIAGIIIWRVIIIINKRNSAPKGGKYFQRKYSDKWKNR